MRTYARLLFHSAEGVETIEILEGVAKDLTTYLQSRSAKGGMGQPPRNRQHGRPRAPEELGPEDHVKKATRLQRLYRGESSPGNGGGADGSFPSLPSQCGGGQSVLPEDVLGDGPPCG